MKHSQLKMDNGFGPRCITLLALLSLSSGCADRSRPVVGPFGPPVQSPLLAPFQGVWKFDLEKTLDAQKAAGIKEEHIALHRKSYEAQLKTTKQVDLSFVDNEALGFPLQTSEYRFFHLHAHDGMVCGKAWRHEDRFDPGDCSKCYVQLAIIDNYLHFRARFDDERTDANDPEFRSPLPVELDIGGKCKVERQGVWGVEVFVRAATK